MIADTRNGHLESRMKTRAESKPDMYELRVDFQPNTDDWFPLNS